MTGDRHPSTAQRARQHSHGARPVAQRESGWPTEAEAREEARRIMADWNQSWPTPPHSNAGEFESTSRPTRAPALTP